MNLRDKINHDAETFSVGTLRTTAYNHNDAEIGQFDTNVDATVEMTDGGGVRITIKVTVWEKTGTEEREMVITVPAYEIVDPYLVDDDDDQIHWVKSRNY